FPPVEERDFIGVDDSDSRLLLLANEEDLDDGLNLKKCIFQRYPRIHIKMGMVDAHLYCLRKYVVDFLVDNDSFSSIRRELVPYLVSKQFSSSHKKLEPDASKKPLAKDIYTCIITDKLMEAALSKSSWNDHRGDMREPYHGSSLRCYVHVAQNELCCRVNSLGMYIEANKQTDHFYLFSYLCSSFSSIRRELVPYLVSKQFSSSHKKLEPDASKKPLAKDIYTCIITDKLMEAALSKSSWNDHRGDMREPYHGSSLRCYVHVAQNELCCRVNSLGMYIEANKQVPLCGLCGEDPRVHPSAVIADKLMVGSDSMVGAQTQVGEKTSIKHSLLGSNCSVRDRVKITNCIIMSGVTVNDKYVWTWVIAMNEVLTTLWCAGTWVIAMNEVLTTLWWAGTRVIAVNEGSADNAVVGGDSGHCSE
ncbi:PREDICTED: translation initiation factor eIF-2B subunit gamma-like, partial [Nanorana parkeri]|uniref:translation initiation factor eIF-2B subunit gamma-like n=1 Tax=Nanorana parkeri TaxID=125878 RepID=UPI0008541B15